MSNKPMVIDYLLTHSFQNLEDEHGVKAYPADDSVFSLNYSQFDAKHGDLLCEQCRGLVIQVNVDLGSLEKDLWKTRKVGEVSVLAWPMSRFYNDGESCAAKIDWNTARVLEKLDGTMIILYNKPKTFGNCKLTDWRVATRKVAYADQSLCIGNVVHDNMTFDSLFKDAVKNTLGVSFKEWTQKLNTELTYVFELTSPHNRVVVKYDDTRITLLAARSLVTGKELDARDVCEMINKSGNVVPPLPRVFDLSSFVSAAAYVSQADPADLEGVVIVDGQFNRVKVKNPKWVMSSRATDSLLNSQHSIVEAIFRNQIDDVLPLLNDDLRCKISEIVEKTKQFIAIEEENFKTWNKDACGNRKEFALRVISSKTWKAPHFMLFEKKFDSYFSCVNHLFENEMISSASAKDLYRTIMGT